MKLPLLGWLLDERFLEHRRRSTSTAGMIAVVLALLLFEYRLIFDHVVSWDLFAIGASFVAVKIALMVFYTRTN
jgi:hypothetical protein